MQLAADMLGKGDNGMSLIAEQVGYKSVVVFSKAFKRNFKVAPGAYRRQFK
jgi:AraC-like DNA-binding protein